MRSFRSARSVTTEEYYLLYVLIPLLDFYQGFVVEFIGVLDDGGRGDQDAFLGVDSLVYCVG